MKTTGVLALAAALVSGVSANAHGHQHFRGARDAPLVLSSKESTDATSCGCTTVYTTFYGPATLVPAASSSAPASSGPTSTVVVPAALTSAPASSVPTSTVVVPTAQPTTFQTPGLYTIPATTITVVESTTVCNPASTQIPSGTHTVGGVVTVVETATDVVCPYATTSTVNGVVTSVILMTTYVCPSAGTYTIAPLTTVAPTPGVWIYPVKATFTPGTYTRAEAVVTVTEIDYAYVCPFTTIAPSFAPTKATQAPVVSSPAASSSAASSPVASSPVASSPASSSPAQTNQVSQVSKTTPSGTLGANSDTWAITYTQYTQEGGCKDANTIMDEVKIIAGKGFTTVRMYGTDCDGLQNIGDAVRAAAITMMIGVYIDNDGVEAARSQVADIVRWAQWDIVSAIICGNEAVHDKKVTVTELVTFVQSCKVAFSGAGYKGPVSLTETVNIWQANAEAFCSVVDVVTFNSHAFHNPETTADKAGNFMESQFSIMNALCPGKSQSYNIECGWPSAGVCNGVACPGVSEQATAMAQIRKAHGGNVVVFSFQDDHWKPAVDQHWGVMGCY